jgi:hypothetical protein
LISEFYEGDAKAAVPTAAEQHSAKGRAINTLHAPKRPLSIHVATRTRQE